MFRYLIVLFLILLTDFSFGQIVLTQTHSDATIGLDRKAWSGLGNTSPLSDGYAHDFTLPARTNPCQQITGIRVEISLTGYANNNVCPHLEIYYNLFYGCTSYAGGATCLPATNLIAEPNYAPNTSPPPFNFGSPLGSPLNPNIVPDFGDNLSIDIIPVSNPGCNPVTNGYISYQYTITVTVTVTDISPTPPTFTQVPAICSGDTLSALTTTSNNSITGTWAPALDNTATTTYTFTPDAGQCATSQTMTIAVNPIITPIFTQVSAICSGDSLSALPTTSNEGVTGTWSPVLDNITTTTYTFTPDTGQCATSQTMTIIVNPIVTPTFTQVSAICSGDTLSALPTTSNEGVTGTWSPVLDNTTTTIYTFTPNTGQCATNQTMSITVNANVTPTFTQVPAICNGDTLAALPTTSNEGITGTWSPTLDNNTTTTYTFTPDLGQCSVSQTMTIIVNPIVTPTFAQVSAICNGDTLSALPTTSNDGITGTWSPVLDNTATTTYTFSPDSGQCAANQTMTIMVNPTGTPTFTQISAICSGDTLSPLPTTSNEGITGTWSPTLDNTITTTYTFTPDSGFCPSPVSLTIEVFNGPVFSLQNEYFLCFNINGIIAIPVTIDTGLNTSEYNFKWLLNGVPIAGASQGTYMPIEGGNYEVIVQHVMTMCESSMLTIVTVLSEPEFEAEVITAPFSENPTIQVTTISSGDFEYQLDDEPWQDESIFNNVSNGEHIVTVRNKNGCMERSQTLVVISYPKFFTPNNDGSNDTWNINSIADQVNAKIYIFNRYGKLLKQISPDGEGWSGIFNGELMPVNDYWFALEYIDTNTGERKMFKAHFTLKR
ncbi:T9SS type B sorting domain-containing protein [uncultured Algibacter sp.]|mgnify:CR=1 FL=1|uniref:T9SS type B sorting domain-containing protein n=1 Tax=uncultured Algibacter sp. TaxID=298659 RepID=UPI0030EEE790